MEPNELRDYLIREYQKWAYAQRELRLRNARGLSNGEKSRLDGYFEKRILDSTRVAGMDRLSNPDFYNELMESRIPIPMDFTEAIGFTLIDCVLIRKELWHDPSAFISTLFHELVHVVQFDVFGPTRMIELYTDYLLKSNYHSVPFERQAYALTDKFVREGSPFSVRETVGIGGYGVLDINR